MAVSAASVGKAQLLRQELGEDSARLFMVDMAELGRNPARIIPAVMTYAGQHLGRPVCCIGEAIWPGRTAAETLEATRHEALINLAFRDSPMTFVCPLIGHRVPPDEMAGGYGLWLVNQVCDLVQARTGQAGPRSACTCLRV